MSKFTMKRILALGLVATLSFTLSACGKADYNTNAPYGDITGNYAVNGTDALTNKQLYDLLRPNGYNVFFNEVEEILLKEYIDELDYNDDKADLADYLNKLFFETDDIEKINLMAQNEIDLILEQLVDSLYVSNVQFNAEDVKITSEGVEYPEVLFDYFKLNLAKERYAEKRLQEEIAKGEEYEEEDEDGVEQTIVNPYYITEKNIETYYNNTYRNTQDFNAVIVGFNTLAEAEATWDDIEITAGQGNYNERFFADLYNAAYPYKTELIYPELNQEGNFFEETIFNSTILSGYNSDLAAFVNKLEEGEFTALPKEFGEKYYFVLRVNEYADTEWKDLTDEELLPFGKTIEEITEEITEELFDAQLTDSFINTQITSDINDLIEAGKISIYDPLLALNFSSKFSDYEYTTKELEDNMNVASIDGTKISVDSYFDTLKDYYGVNAAYNYFTGKAIASSRYMDELTDEDIETAEDLLSDELKSFKKDEYASSGLTSEFTEEQYLSMMYGYDNEGDVLDYYFKPMQALQYFGTIYDENYFELLELVSRNNYYNYYSLNIKHVLLYVDYDLDGNMDNPAEFMNKLSADDQRDFEQTIVNIYTAVYNEVTYLELGESAALDYVAKAFNQNKALVAPENKNLSTDDVAGNDWANWNAVKTSEGKNFNIQIKVEDLGTVDTSTGSNYVTEFSTHVQNMYNNLKAEFKAEDGFVEGEDTEDKYFMADFGDFLNESHLEKIQTNTEFDTLCMSTFGFHMLLSTKGSTASSSIFASTSDYKADSDDEYKQYEHIFVELNGTEEYINAYSETPYPSLNQLKVYVYEKDTDDGIENLKSYTETLISSFYSGFNSTLTNQTVMNYYLYQELNMNIVFDEYSDVDSNMNERWFDINYKTMNNYADDSNGLYAGMWDLIKELYTEEN
ncbi:MAG: hypothetical protein R3Y05_05130 [bacterium]